MTTLKDCGVARGLCRWKRCALAVRDHNRPCKRL